MVKVFEDFSAEYEEKLKLFEKYHLDVDQCGNTEYIGDIDVRYYRLTELPDFGIIKVNGSYLCSGNPSLESLENSPKYVSGTFSCSSCNIESLEHGPFEVGVDYYCQNNNLKNLKHSPTKVKGSFNCSYNEISSIEGIPSKCVSYNMKNNLLTSLDYLPDKGAIDVVVVNNPLLSLKFDNSSAYVGTKVSEPIYNVPITEIYNSKIEQTLIYSIDNLEPHQVSSQIEFFERYNETSAVNIMLNICSKLGYDVLDPEDDPSELF